MRMREVVAVAKVISIPPRPPLRARYAGENATIHAATKLGTREYSRSKPPSLSRHLIAPCGLTRSSRGFGE